MRDIIQQFLGHEAGPLIQFIKYGIAGGLATAVHIVIFHLFAWKVLPALQAKDAFVRMLKLDVKALDDGLRSHNSMIDNGLAFLLSNLVAYFLNIMWVFEAGRHHWIVEVLLFYAVSGVSVFIGTAIMGYLIKRFSMRTTYAFLANIVSAVLINFVVRKYLIFNG